MRGVAALLALLCACSYTSQYQPPRDGRARVVWDRSRASVHLAYRPTPACDKAVTETVEGQPLAIAPSYTYTQPASHGPRVMFIPFIFWFPYPFPVPVGFWAVASGRDFVGKMQVFAVLALAVLPLVAIGLAASDPEDSKASALAIDAANAYNDLNRMEGSPCY